MKIVRSKKLIISLLLSSPLLGDTPILTQPQDNSRAVEKLLSKLAPKDSSSYRYLAVDATNRYGVDLELVMAIMRVESGFDRYAVSQTGALGLMQLKLDQAIADVYTQIYGQSDIPPSPSFFDPELNIEVGVAYLWLVSYKYFAGIKDPKTKEYCMIAAYNAGAGTVLRTFDQDKIKAQEVINSMSPEKVLFILKTKMDSEQGRRYIAKVLDAKKQSSLAKIRFAADSDSFID